MRLVKSAKQVRAYARGEVTESFVAHVPVDVDVKALRSRLGYSQSPFSSRFGFAVEAVQDWERHLTMPDRTARIRPKVIEREPDAVTRTLARQRVTFQHRDTQASSTGTRRL